MRHRTWILVLLFSLLALGNPGPVAAQAPASAPQRLVVFEAFMRST